MTLGARLTARLDRSGPVAFALFAVAAAFTTYFCMYAFRKPFAVATYGDARLGPLDLKGALVVIVLWAEAALVVFALVPPGGKALAIFANGLPLGAVWGVAFSFLEGRTSSDILGAGLSCSYIVASGLVKTVGAALLVRGVSESWMPAAVGAMFMPLFFLAAWALSRVPPPSPDDVRARTARAPMDRAARRRFMARHALGLVFLVLVYFFLTAYRDFRDNFAADIWQGLGRSGEPELFALSELAVAAPVLIGMVLLYRVRDNRNALIATFGLMIAGSVLVGAATLLFDLGAIGPMPWTILVGVGLYLGYVPYGCVLFDRLIGALGVVATAVFLIYISDAVAYAGSVGVVLYKKLGQPEVSMLDFFRGLSYATSVASTVLFALAAGYFLRRSRAPR
jgi:hypothetical protein